jgi:cell division protein FtsN
MRHDRGGFAMGLIVGLLIGLALALGVALYVAKVPVPFVNKVPQRTAEQDAAEAERNKKWDPNAGLSGKAASASAAGAPVAPPAVSAMPTPVIAGRAASGVPAKPARDPAAILAGQDTAPPPRAAAASGVAAASTKPDAEPFVYFVQAGAYSREEEAEQQRAKLAMLGFAAKVTEREQSGRPVFRVRLGPFDQKETADAAQARLQAAGSEAALVRIFR